ncbi:MAG: GSCFA domain-containing protein [Flavobacteriaceae bacterium]|nr:GSCFA domain-containing protein [Flavobacteriaceae bacterium]
MKLQTTIPLKAKNNPIDYTSKVLVLGSCFAEHMGGKLEYFKFQKMQNPFGIVFHPLAIECLVKRAVTNQFFTEADVLERNGQWFSFEAHSTVTSDTKEGLVALLNSRLEQFSAYLSEASHIIFTYGTAWVYRHMDLDCVVANCHKIPQKNFSKELLSVGEVSASLERTAQLISEVNPLAISITTVSPVRHFKDGFVENMLSKSHLIAGFHHFNNSQSHYFPSYELMMDELRDYRFYEEDMIHPNPTAITYIWEKFKLVWIASETEQLQNEIDSIQKGLKHRAFNPNSNTHLKFQQNLQQKIEKVQKELPFVKF